MMERLTWGVMGLALALVWAPASGAEEPLVLDVRPEGSDSAHAIAFYAHTGGSGDAKGIGVASGSRSGEGQFSPAHAYGIVAREEGPEGAATIEQERFRKLWNSEAEGDRVRVIVAVTAQQRQDAEVHLNRWKTLGETPDAPTTTLLNCTENVVHTLGIDRPYRTRTGRGDGQQYYEDLVKMNRSAAVDAG